MSDEMRDQLASEYVLGLLEGDALAGAERLIEIEPAFATLVEDWRRRMAELDVTAALQPPTPDLWDRIETSLASSLGAPKTSPANPRRQRTPVRGGISARLWNHLPVWRGIGLAASAAALVMAIGVGILMRENARTPVMVAVLLSDQNRPAAVVNAFSDGRTELVPLTAITAPEGKSLQVWTLWDRARGPVSVGLMDAMHSLDLAVQNLPRTTTDQLFEVTLEPAGGSPTGRPTGPILMKGNASLAL